MSTTDNRQLQDVIDAARFSDSSVVHDALAQEQAFRAQTEAELALLLSEIRAKISKAEQDPETIAAQILTKNALDLQLSQQLDTELEKYTAGINCNFTLKFNKMTPALRGSQAFSQKYSDFILYDSSSPPGYEYHSQPQDITILGSNPNTIYGDSKGTFFKTAIVETSLVCTGGTNLGDIHLSSAESSSSWTDTSALTHVTAMPQGFNWEAIHSDFSQFSFRFSDVQTPNGFAFVHSGYAYGGQRSESKLYPNGKLYGPEGCCSWIRKITGCSSQFSICDQLFYYRLKTGQDVITEAWKNSTPKRQAMENVFDIVEVRDPQRDIQAGQIHSYCYFNKTMDPSMEETMGTDGHTDLVLGFLSNGPDSEIIGLGYDRDMPNVEGFGVIRNRWYPEPDEHKKVMLFSLKTQKTMSLSDVPFTTKNKPSQVKLGGKTS